MNIIHRHPKHEFEVVRFAQPDIPFKALVLKQPYR